MLRINLIGFQKNRSLIRNTQTCLMKLMTDQLIFRKIMVIKSKLCLFSWNLTNGAKQGNLQLSEN
jgi:hypothetical protein